MKGPCPIPVPILAFHFLRKLAAAHRQFGRGLLLNEEPLMSHVCAQTHRIERRSVFGFPIQVNSQAAVLHRKGINQTDKFGCDIAWTVRAFSGKRPWYKTAFFQLKMITLAGKGKARRVDVERKQIDDANRPGFWERAFAVAVDPDSCEAFVAPLAGLPSLAIPKMRVQCSTKPWLPIDLWMCRWLCCLEGKQGSEGEEQNIDPENLVDSNEPSPRIRLRIKSTIEAMNPPDEHLQG